jgi:hypothetical protein
VVVYGVGVVTAKDVKKPARNSGLAVSNEREKSAGVWSLGTLGGL